MALDLYSLFVLLALTQFGAAAVLLFFYRMFPNLPGLRQWFWASCFIVAGSLFYVIPPPVPSVQLILPNYSFFFAYYFFYLGMCRFTEKQPRKDLVWSILLAGVVFFILVPKTQDFITWRILATSLVLSSLSILSARVLILAADKNQLAQKTVGWIFAAMAIAHMVRSVAGFSVGNYDEGLLNSVHFMDQVNVLWVMVVQIAYTSGFIIMTSEMFRNELNQKIMDVETAHRITEQSLTDQKNFFTMISHEFKSPLAGIHATAEAIELDMGNDDTLLQEDVERIKRSVTRLSGLVDNVMRDEWVEVQMENPVFAAVELKPLVQELCDEYDVPLAADQHDYPPLHGNVDLLSIAISSLLSNACKYCENRQSVAATLVKSDQALSLSICNDGAAISAEALPYIFKKYHRGTPENTETGAGLGLYFVQEIAARHRAVCKVRQKDAFINFTLEFETA